MKTIEILSRDEIKKLIKEEVEKKTFKQDRLINLINRKLIDLDRIVMTWVK